MEKFCQVGNHPIPSGNRRLTCVICNITFCYEHAGNSPRGGGYFGCPSHRHQVDGLNRDLYEAFLRNARKS